MTDVLTPPSNVAYEKRILGAALMSADALVVVVQKMRPRDFFAVAHRATFEAISAAAASGVAEPTLIARSLQRASAPGIDDPYEFVADLTENPAPTSVLDEFIEDVRACSDARSLAELGRRLTLNAMTANGDPEAVRIALTDADNALQKATAEIVGVPWLSMDAIAADVLDEDPDEANRITFPTGFLDLDKKLMGGLRPKQLVVLAARPAQGKSTLAMDVARNLSFDANVPGLIVSLEMPREELAKRALSAEARVPLATIQRRERVTDRDGARLADAVEKIQGAPLYVVDQIEPTLPAIRAVMIAAKRRLDVKYVVVDYLQLIASDGTKNPSREQQVANVSRTMKALARILDIVIIAVAQLNRGPEQRTDRVPHMSDLRESGQLEQDGDIILLLHRPDYYEPESPRAGEADVIVAKQRNGETGTVVLAFQGHYARFADMAHGYEEA